MIYNWTIKPALDYIWFTYSALQNKFTLLADDVNKINLNKIRARNENLSQLDVTQVVNSFNGVKDLIMIISQCWL
ncbi:hypothetical protein RhiirA4_487028 [Rhizophagus irregularis]|uniref:Uncharacterized protein n=1 Tax=Rhizophagus irregularis TaxID=588596 RepID=A0A2I1HS34_9GLOM|nr:hypothetical protein RhiirA4_487028 [Rhizophagus irregularis]